MSEPTSNQRINGERIWELDAFRGVAILLMMFYHLMFDLVYYYGVGFRPFWAQWSAYMFMLLCGAMCCLSRSNLKRAGLILGMSLVVTVVTYVMDSQTYVRFGILQFLGVSVLLYELVLRRCNNWVLGGIAVLSLFRVPFLMDTTRWYLIPLGVIGRDFYSLDYYPLLPYFSVFTFGVLLFRLLYRERRTRLPYPTLRRVLSPLCVLGRYSLPIYLIHQPVIFGLLYLIFKIL